MLRSVPTGKSRFGSGTVTRPFLTGCLNCAWLPLRATSFQPSASRSLITPRLCMVCIYTHGSVISSDGLAVASGIFGTARTRLRVEAAGLVGLAVFVGIVGKPGGDRVDADETCGYIHFKNGG